jgi:glycine/D-amino acid oxidase-like deaminating enzyme
VDNRGFRVRGAERAPTPPQTAQGATATPSTPNRPVSTAGAAPDAGSNLANAGRGGAGGAAANTGGGRGGQQQQAEVPAAQQDPDTSDRWADMTRIDGSRRFVAHRFPLLKDAPVAQTHACHYESTSSGNFVIDKHPQWGNVWIAAGGNAEGFKFAPKIGDYVAGRVMGKTDPNVDKQFRIPENDYPPPPPATTTPAQRPPE